MKTSETITTIVPALLAAQRKMGAAPKGSNNPYFKSKYADLGTVMEVCKEPLNDAGILILQSVGHTASGETFVETVLVHECGEFISDQMIVSVKEANNPQAQGSSITYARRYALQSLLFIPAEDDDGNKATGHQSQQAQQQKVRPARPQPVPQEYQQEEEAAATETKHKIVSVDERHALPMVTADGEGLCSYERLIAYIDRHKPVDKYGDRVTYERLARKADPKACEGLETFSGLTAAHRARIQSILRGQKVEVA